MSAEPAIPILLYHKIGRPPRGARVRGHYVSPGLFRRHLTYLRGQGYESIPLAQVVGSDRPLPALPVVITFDDGYRCLYEQALPVLAEFGFGATVFLVAGALGDTNTWEQAVGDVAEPMLELRQIREMQEADIEFGSHTMGHPHLTALPEEAARREVVESRRNLEDSLQAPCLNFAYPYGDWDARVRDLVAEAGYEAACTTRRAAARRRDDPLALPRINIRRYNVTARFAYKLWRARRAGS
ncbi:MAG: polysaccharide deacetylase family protein [Armatimonadota bacterium]|nr:MAG: polysaccharide deacetylase family protein [Armatimonadota bacterium]